MNLVSKDDLPTKKTYLEVRKQQAKRVLREYEGYVPVYVEKSPKARIPNVVRNQYLIATNVPIGILIFKLRKEINLNPEEGLFFFIDNSIPSNTALLGELYKNYHNPDDLHLHVTYTNENVYG